MTERLYYTDATLCDFTARIVARQESERGPAVNLDRTAFYPTSGGQPCDTGRLNDVAVLDVWQDEEGEVWHLLENSTSGDDVHGEINWSRRFDHMQQHSGQHLLSAAFVRLLNAPTISFHLGAQESSIDLDTSELSWQRAFQVEADVNRIIWENRPVEIHVVVEGEIHKVPLRRPPKVSGKIRVIWVPDYDASACGGTHVSQTGAVGLVKVTRIERYKGGVRVGFLCGERALRDYQRVLRDVQQASTDLSVHPDELGDAISRLRDESKEARRALRAAQGELTAFEAERLWTETPESGGVRRILANLEDISFEQARAIASRLCERPRTLALLAVSEPKGIRIVCQRSDDLAEQEDAAALVRRAAETLGGRGGGTASQAQGGASAQPHETILEALRKAAAAE
jgi:alanyl-tRNA synthetase